MLHRFLLRFPAVACDLLMGAILYASARRRLRHALAALVMASFIFNPAIIFDSANYGQTDAIHSLMALAAMVLIDKGLPAWGWVFMGLGMMTKPQTYVLAPLLVLVTGRRFGLRGLITGGLAALGAMLLIASPFFLYGALDGFIKFSLSFTDLQPIVSANADNFWWLVQLGESAFISDRAPLPLLAALGLTVSYRTVGLALLLSLHLLVWRRVWQRPRSPELYVWGAASVMIFFSAATQMHDNYLYMALPFLAMVCHMDRRLLAVYLIFSITCTANMALHYPAIVEWLVPHNPDIFRGPELFWPRLATSAVQTGVIAWFLWSFARRGCPEEEEAGPIRRA